MTASPFSVRRFIIIFSIGWIALMADHSIILSWFGWPLQEAILDSIISNILLLLICLIMMNTLRYYLPRGSQYINILVIGIILTLLWLLLVKWLLDLVLGNHENYREFLNSSIIIRFSISFLVLGIVTTITIIWFNWQEEQKSERRDTEKDKLNKEAELFKLRQQLQPHFLFNSLNSINALIGTKPGEARKMVQQLSDFLRGTIRKEENKFITFAEELEYLNLYLEIEKVRFGYRLKTEMDIATEAMEWKMPALLIQPLMENAIKFGLYGTTGEVVIRLQAVVSDNYLKIAITNPFDPDMQMPEGTGFGLKSVKRRLYLLFERNDLIEINKTHEAFIVAFRIPKNNE